MYGGNINAARSLPIDAALIGDVLRRLRRDTRGSAASWMLGTHGSAEIDIDFFPVAAPTDVPAWTTTARLWDPEAVAMVRATIELTAVAADSCTLTARPDVPLTPWWSARMPALLGLSLAALDELAEELLWHATRDNASAP
jgi:hypothetical protein